MNHLLAQTTLFSNSFPCASCALIISIISACNRSTKELSCKFKTMETVSRNLLTSEIICIFVALACSQWASLGGAWWTWTLEGVNNHALLTNWSAQYNKSINIIIVIYLLKRAVWVNWHVNVVGVEWIGQGRTGQEEYHYLYRKVPDAQIPCPVFLVNVVQFEYSWDSNLLVSLPDDFA